MSHTPSESERIRAAARTRTKPQPHPLITYQHVSQPEIKTEPHLPERRAFELDGAGRQRARLERENRRVTRRGDMAVPRRLHGGDTASRAITGTRHAAVPSRFHGGDTASNAITETPRHAAVTRQRALAGARPSVLS